MQHDFSRESEDLIIVPFTIEYAELYRQLRNDPNNQVFFFSNKIISQKEQVNWFNRYISDESQVMFAILFRHQMFIGGCGLYNIDKKEGVAEFGRIIISESFRHKGIGYQASQSVFEIAKYDMGLSQIYIKVKKDNISSIKTYQKCGFCIQDELSDEDELFMTKRL